MKVAFTRLSSHLKVKAFHSGRNPHGRVLLVRRTAATDTSTVQQISGTTRMYEEDASTGSDIQAASYLEQPFSTESTTPPSLQKPGELDATRFELDASVSNWLNIVNENQYRSYGDSQQDNRSDLGLSQVQQLLVEAQVFSDVQSAAYWAYHLSRTTFFAGNAVLSVLAEQLSTQLRAPQGGVRAEAASTTVLNRMLENPEKELAFRLVEAFGMYKQDLACIKEGSYKLPWDMTTLTHRQYNPLFMLRRSAAYIDEAVQTLARRARRATDPLWMQSSMYPDYYLNTFHYQSDGWMSARSADTYETSTEVLFFGRQDAMQRSALVPIHRFLQGRAQKDTTLLEVAAGTGRFHTFIKDNYPAMPTIVSDLSPFYLSRARTNVKYWKQQRQPDRDLGRTEATGTSFLQCAAENIALPDQSVDIVVAVYLYHELPREVREAATREMFRVLKPGGLAVLTDSVQLGDRGVAWDNSMANFGNFNEPYYRDYVACDLGDMFQRAGFECGTKWIASATKTLSFRKP